jgi:hypothetical protein
MKIYIGIYQDVTFEEKPFEVVLKENPLYIIYKRCDPETAKIGQIVGHLTRNRGDKFKLIDIIVYTGNENKKLDQNLLRVLNCMDQLEFDLVMSYVSTDKGYLQEKWEKFRDNLAKFLMCCDADVFDKFVEYAEEKYKKQNC